MQKSTFVIFDFALKYIYISRGLIVLKRKIYNDILKWKNESKGKTALLIEGARRVGKSYIVESFAKDNYKTYILIDFSKVSKEVLELFDNYLDNLNYLFV